MTNLKFYSWKYNIREEKNDWIVFKRLDNAEKEPANLKTSEQEFSNWKREEKNNWKN